MRDDVTMVPGIWASDLVIDHVIVDQVHGILLDECTSDHDQVHDKIHERLQEHGIQVEGDVLDATMPNMSMVHGLSELMCQDQLTIEDMARFVRGESSHDTRPNKSISVKTIGSLFQGYKHSSLLLDMCRFGFYPKFNEGVDQDVPGRDSSIWSATASRPNKSRLGEQRKVNHKSADDYPMAVSMYIRDGQRNGTLLVLDDALIDKWRLDHRVRIYSSPLGVVAKKGADMATKGRVITDLSWPPGGSINEMTIQGAIPSVVWGRVSTVGKRIMQLAKESGWTPMYPQESSIYGSTADVNAAFRNLRCNADMVRHFAVHVPDLKVVAFDLSAPFGWTGSPAFYGVVGNAISWLLGGESPQSLNPSRSDDDVPFFPFEYVDDHICVELDRGDRLAACTHALKLAMMATLGPNCINEKKCTGWTQQLHALGLDWDLQRCTVSMPREKVEKALTRVQALLDGNKVTKLQLQQLLGSLRHVCTCNPSAKAFYQRIQAACNRTDGRHPAPISDELRADATVFVDILDHGRLDGIPLEIFTDIQEPDVHLYMDASDMGLAVLDPSGMRYIQVKFDRHEVELVLRAKLLSHFKLPPIVQRTDKTAATDDFSINVREFLSVVLAIGTWGDDWACAERPIHIRVWLDNMAAVKWTNTLNSPNQLGQRLCRKLGLSIARCGIHVSAQHLPGEQNTMADAGSRIWESPVHFAKWSTLSKGWSRCQVEATLRKAYITSNDVATPWPHRPARGTTLSGTSGVDGAQPTGSHNASQQQECLVRNNFTTTHFGSTGDHIRSALRPSDPSFARSVGITSAAPDMVSDYTPDTLSVSRGLNEPNDHGSLKNQSRSSSCGPCEPTSIDTTPKTARSGALRSWATSFFSGAPSTPRLQPTRTTTSDAGMSRFKV